MRVSKDEQDTKRCERRQHARECTCLHVGVRDIILVRAYSSPHEVMCETGTYMTTVNAEAHTYKAGVLEHPCD